MRRIRIGSLVALATTIICTSVTINALHAQQLQLRRMDGPRRLTKEESLQRELQMALKSMGHRNWIVIADSAYPEQASAGIKTFASGMKQLDVVKKAMEAVERAPHVRGIVYVDKELEYVSPDDAPGIEKYREDLKELLKGKKILTQLHEATIYELDAAAETYRVLVIKTDMVLPYTSVFIQLDCGYWSAEAEQRMRDKMKQDQ